MVSKNKKKLLRLQARKASGFIPKTDNEKDNIALKNTMIEQGLITTTEDDEDEEEVKEDNKNNEGGNELKFGRYLASNEKRTRDLSTRALRAYLSQKNITQQGQVVVVFNELDMLKIWKGLFYCMWMSDKTMIQQELAKTISQLIHVFPGNDRNSLLNAQLFFRVFLKTMSKEWTGLDGLRLDKFYSLIRKIMTETLIYIHKHLMKMKKSEKGKKNNNNSMNEEDIYQPFMEAIYEEVLMKTPNGLRYHLADVYVSSLHVACHEEVSTKIFVKLMQPFLKVITHNDESIMFKRTMENIFMKLIPTMVEKEKEKNGDDDDDMDMEDMDNNTQLVLSDDVMTFEHVNLKEIKEILFDVASGKSTREQFRKPLYTLVKNFERELKKGHYRVPKSNDDDDDDDDDDEAEEEEKKQQKSKKRNRLETNEEEEIKNSKKEIAKKVVEEEQKQQEGISKKKKQKKTKDVEPVVEVEAEAEPKQTEKKNNKKKRKLSVDENDEITTNEAQAQKKEKKVEAEEEEEKVTPKAKKAKVTATKKAKEEEEPLPTFVKSKKFKTRLPGYIYKKDKLGLGYYKDIVGSSFDKKEKKIVSSQSSKQQQQRQQQQETPKKKTSEKVVVIPDFIKSKKFTGSKEGFVFKKDKKGLGYYKDTYVHPPSKGKKGGKNNNNKKGLLTPASIKVGKQKKKTSLSSPSDSSSSKISRRVSFGKNRAKNYKDSVKDLKAFQYDKDATPTKLILKKKPNEVIPINSKKLNSSVTGGKRRNAASYF